MGSRQYLSDVLGFLGGLGFRFKVSGSARPIPGLGLVAEFISPKKCTLSVLWWVILSQKV